MSIWVGAYKPRMLRLVGQAADGVLPSLSYLPGGPGDYADLNKHIDDSAREAGRDPPLSSGSTVVERLFPLAPPTGAAVDGAADHRRAVARAAGVGVAIGDDGEGVHATVA
jgi:hypothetical protein